MVHFSLLCGVLLANGHVGHPWSPLPAVCDWLSRGNKDGHGEGLLECDLKQVLYCVHVCYYQLSLHQWFSGWSGLDPSSALHTTHVATLCTDPANRDYLVDNDGIELTVKSLTRCAECS